MSAADAIRITGLSARGHHGVLAGERRDGQEFVVDVVLRLDLALAGAGDDLARTVHYGEVAQAVHQEVTGEPLELIEALAERIAARILADWELVVSAEVTVHKPRAPLPVPFRDVAVTVVRGRG